MKIVNLEEIMTASENPARAVSWMYTTDPPTLGMCGPPLRVLKRSTKKIQALTAREKRKRLV